VASRLRSSVDGDLLPSCRQRLLVGPSLRKSPTGAASDFRVRFQFSMFPAAVRTLGTAKLLLERWEGFGLCCSSDSQWVTASEQSCAAFTECNPLHWFFKVGQLEVLPQWKLEFSNWRLSELPQCIGHVARDVCSCGHFVLSCRLTLRRQFQGVICPGGL